MFCFNNLKNNRDTSDKYLNDLAFQGLEDYKLWVPGAENVFKTQNLKMRTRGEYDKGYPEGIVVHWTAGWGMKKNTWLNPFPIENKITPSLSAIARKYALKAVKEGVKNGYNYLVMDVYGRIYQSRPLNKFGYHAGKSYLASIGRSVSSKLAGIELLNFGKLTYKKSKFYTWFGLEVPSELVRIRINNLNTGKQSYYQMFTVEQEDSLICLCKWLQRNSPLLNTGDSVFNYKNIVGHDEVSPGRKFDPGGSLSFTMDEFRRTFQDGI